MYAQDQDEFSSAAPSAAYIPSLFTGCTATRYFCDDNDDDDDKMMIMVRMMMMMMMMMMTR